MKYKWKDSHYNIVVKNPKGKNKIEIDKSKVLLNGNEVDNYIKLDGSRNSYELEIIL